MVSNRQQTMKIYVFLYVSLDNSCYSNGYYNEGIEAHSAAHFLNNLGWNSKKASLNQTQALLCVLWNFVCFYYVPLVNFARI